MVRSNNLGNAPNENILRNLAAAHSLFAQHEPLVSNRRGDVKWALRRLDEGRYGVCVDCEKRIPEARLRANPAALRCVACQQEHERAVARARAMGCAPEYHYSSRH